MLILPSPLPDELDRSYLGRVMRVNGISNESEMLRRMAKQAGMEGLRPVEAPTVVLLAKMAGVEVPSFVKQHTMLPLRRGITSYLPELGHGSESNFTMLRHSAMRVARPGAYFCRHCVAEDYEFHGLSYWRREHQIPGLFWCEKHGNSLHYTDAKQSLLEPPSRFLADCHEVSDWATDAMGSRRVQSFLAISSALMDRVSPFGVRHVSAILRARAVAQGFQTSYGEVKAPLLSDAVVAAFSRQWLATVLPVLADKRRGELLNQMDGVLYMTNSASSAAAYILALAILFESADEALHALTRMDGRAVVRRQHKIPRRIKDRELRSAYTKARGSYAETAGTLSTSYGAVCRRLRSMGLPNLVAARKPGLEKAIMAFLVEGRSLTDSAIVGGITENVLEDLLRTTGLGFIDVLQEMKGPKTGRGSGVRRPQRLTPHEVDSSTDRMATKFCPRSRPEQRLLLQQAEP